MTDPIAVHDIPLLTDAECERVRRSVMALRPQWTQRHPALPMYTLGAASYIDAVGDAPPYAGLARTGNPLLWQHFAWLYERLAAVLSQVLGAPAEHARALGLPGFHIFLAAKAFEQPLASVHFDLQYRLHDWRTLAAGHEVDLDHPVSFTLAIALPRHGGGLMTWDLTLAERQARAGETPAQLAPGQTPAFHAYRRGHLALHSGHLLHQMAPGIDLQSTDERITLQGHGVRAGGVWRLYW